MSCLPELTYAVYLDGELPAQEALQVEGHLAACDRCRSLVQALRAENRLLVEVFQPAAEPAAVAARPLGPLDVLWTTVGVLAAAAVLQPALAWLAGLSVPLAADWLNPFSPSGQVGLLFSSVFYFLEEGADTVMSTVTTISALVLGLLVLAGGVLLLRRRPSAVAVLATLALALLVAQPAAALERRKGSSVTIASGETLDDTLLAMGETVTIDGVITGNLIAMGKQHSITGTVKGDVLALGERVEIDGTVEGNLIVFAKWLSIQGEVAQSVYAFSDGFTLTPEGSVSGDLLVFGGQVNVDGTVHRDVNAFAGMTSVRGTVRRHLTARTRRLTLLAPAHVGGDLTAYCKKKDAVHIESGATVAGETKTILPLARARASRFTRPGFYLWQGVWLAAAFLTGLLLHWLFPSLFALPPQSAGGVLRTAGIGFLALLAMFVGSLIAAVTIVGLPIGLLGLGMGLAGFYLAKIFVAAFLGQVLLRPSAGQFALPLLVGLLIVFAAFHIPYLGWLLYLLIIPILGMGIAMTQIHKAWRARQPA
ncbi:MAG: zf-HC2 domain-containing protein [Terriglobia bacterium]